MLPRESSHCKATLPDPKCDGLPWYCTLRKGHRGDHIAKGPDKEELHRWPRQVVP